MRIAVCRPQVPFVYGGAEVVADQLVDELRLRGHEAELVAISGAYIMAEEIPAQFHGRAVQIFLEGGECAFGTVNLPERKDPVHYNHADNSQSHRGHSLIGILPVRPKCQTCRQPQYQREEVDELSYNCQTTDSRGARTT